MNPNQINDIINSAMFTKNVAVATPFSKGAYLAFVSAWKAEYAKLTRAIRANKLLEKDRKSIHFSLTEEQLAKFTAEANYVRPSQIGPVAISQLPVGPGWLDQSARLKPTAHFLLALRKKMKVEANASYQASQTTSGQPETKALSQSTTADSRS